MFCLLVECDAKRMDFYNFISENFASENKSDAYKLFSQKILVPFRDAIASHFATTGATALEVESMTNSLKNDLKTAKNYVFMEYFIITPGKMWGEIYDILKQKIIEGVKVYVLYDDIGSMKKTPTDFDTLLRAEGFSAYKFNPITPIATTVHNNRDNILFRLLPDIALIVEFVEYVG